MPPALRPELKPISLFGQFQTPGTWTVALILHELGLQYDHNLLEADQQNFEKIYKGLGLPVAILFIEDPDKGFKLWDAGAIADYLVDTYDAKERISYRRGSLEYWQCKQWLMVEECGIGPSMVAGFWLKANHCGDVVCEYYRTKSEKYLSFLDSALRSKGTCYLVGNKLTYADLIFAFTAHRLTQQMCTTEEDREGLHQMIDKYPAFKKWLDPMQSRPNYVKVWKHDRVAASANSRKQAGT